MDSTLTLLRATFVTIFTKNLAKWGFLITLYHGASHRANLL